MYSVTVSGDCRDPVTKSATLAVKQIVAATALADLNLCPGATATFSTIGSGTGVSYSWSKDGLPISGANSSSYSIANVSAGDAER